MKRSPIPALLVAASLAVPAFEGAADPKLKYIALSQIRVNPVALREVDLESESYKGLVASIKEAGVLNAITVRAKKDAETGAAYFELIDGLHRFTASRDAGKETIPAQILTAEDAKVLELQLIGNIHKVETTPMEYTGQLIRILKQNPTMTESELSTKLGKSPNWVGERLKLMNLTAPAQVLVNEGKIVLTNAFQLAKLPKEEQDAWLVRAQTESPDKFVPDASNRKRELDKAVRAGRATEEEKFTLTAHLQKLADLKAEAENPSHVATLIHKHGIKDPVHAAKLALQWVLSSDPETAATRQAKWEADNKRRKEEATARALATKEKRAKEAQERTDRVRGEVEALKAKQQGTPVGATA